MTPLAGIAKRAAGTPKIGKPVSRTLGLVGARHTARKVAILNGAPVPETVEILLPRWFRHRTVLMRTDQIAQRAWSHGWKRFERPLPAFYAGCLQWGGVALDIGANTGYYALLGASTHKNTIVHAFEPLPAAADRMEENLALNEQAARVIVVRQAVDSTPGTAKLLVPPSGGQVPTSASLEHGFQPEWADAVTVPRTTVDEYARRLKVNVLKIDVEGAEPRVLEGAIMTLRNQRPFVFFEAIRHGEWQTDLERIDAVRKRAGYVSVQLFREGAIVKSRGVTWDAECENQALWPKERIEDLRELTSRLRTGYLD